MATAEVVEAMLSQYSFRYDVVLYAIELNQGKDNMEGQYKMTIRKNVMKHVSMLEYGLLRTAENGSWPDYEFELENYKY